MGSFSNRLCRIALALHAAFWLCRASPAEAQPGNILDVASFSGATLAAVHAQGTGFNQVVILADSAASRLLFYSSASRQQIGMPFALQAGCAPGHLLGLGTKLYVPCSGIAKVEILDLSSLSADSPVVTSLSTVAVGNGPNRLFQHQDGSTSLLFVQNATDKTLSIISLSSANAPIGINANDSTEVPSQATAPVPVAVCGPMPSTSQAQGIPVGLGVGTQRIYVACDDASGAGMGRISYFNPFVGGDFSQSFHLDLGLPRLAAAAGAAGIFGFYLQASDGRFAVADVSQAEVGGQVALPLLATGQTYITGPTSPQGLLPFIDASAQAWLSLWGGGTTSQIEFYNVSDLSNPAYVPPASRVASASVVSGLAPFVGTTSASAIYASGNLFLPNQSAQLSVLSSGPVFTLVSGTTPLSVSSLTSAGLGACPDSLPLTNNWTAAPAIDTNTYAATLKKSTNASYALAATGPTGSSGAAIIGAADVADLAGNSEQMVLRISAQDNVGNLGLVQKQVLLDGQRPQDVTGVLGSISQQQIAIQWATSTDPGTPSSGVGSYTLEVVRDQGLATERTLAINSLVSNSFNGTITDFDPAEPPIEPCEMLWASLAVCDFSGNRSVNFSAQVPVRAGCFGAAGAFGETGGCALGAGADTGGLWLLVLAAAGILAWRAGRRREGPRT